MDERSTGLIIRLRPLTESSLIVHWITEDLGRIATVAKGARRANSPFRGKLDLFYLAELSLRRSRRSELHNLVEVKLRQPHAGLREDWVRLQLGAYTAALIENATETDTPIPELYELLVDFIGHLAEAPASVIQLLAFETKALCLLGLDPTHQTGPWPEQMRETLHRLAENDWAALRTMELAPNPVRHLAGLLHSSLASGLGRVPKSRAAALRALGVEGS